MSDPYKYFRIEGRELIEQLGQGLLEVERAPSADVMARMLRQAHTLKGAARVVKQSGIAEHAHRLEDLFTELRDRTERPLPEDIDRALALLDQIGAALATLEPTAAPVEDSAPAHVAPPPVHGARPDSADVEALIRGIGEAQAHLGRVRPGLDEAARIGDLIELIDHQLAAIDARWPTAPTERSRIRTAASLVDELRTRFASLQRHVTRGVDRIDGELRQVGDAAARLRLVLADAVFHFLERAARDTAHAVGKGVVFWARGGEIRVDSDILTIVQGALLQLVRNAVAHGIEAPEERRRAGKRPEGQVHLTVQRRDAVIVFTCSDDGAGVDAAAVRERLKRKGLPATGSDDALIRMLLKGGVTTSSAVTDVSGRGIGLDIVREAAERLHGEVTMRSRRGQGTTVELIVPASVASFRALLLEAAGVVAAVPLDAVRRTIRITPGDVVEQADRQSIVWDGAHVPVWSLRGLVRSEEGHTKITRSSTAVVLEAGPPTTRTVHRAVEADSRTAAVIVDRMLGTGIVVMRPLPAMAAAAPPIAGASVEAGGRPRIVLDPVALITEAERGGIPAVAEAPPRPLILVVDDSLTTRMLEQTILESAGYDVTLASSGEEGLVKARERDYALFLVDVEMPGIDGFHFLEQVRADPVLRRIPAILVTSRASDDDHRRGRDVGAQGYIVKSAFDQAAFLDQIRSLV